MDKYACSICGEVYNPAEGYPQYGIESGISFEDIPGDFTICGTSKDQFEKE